MAVRQGELNFLTILGITFQTIRLHTRSSFTKNKRVSFQQGVFSTVKVLLDI